MCDFQVDEPNKVFPVLTLGHGLAWEGVHFFKQAVAFARQYIHMAAQFAQRQKPSLCCPLGEYNHTFGPRPFRLQERN